MTWLPMSDLDEASYEQDNTSSQTVSLKVESNCYKTKQGLKQLKSRLVYSQTNYETIHLK